MASPTPDGWRVICRHRIAFEARRFTRAEALEHIRHRRMMLSEHPFSRAENLGAIDGCRDVLLQIRTARHASA